MRKSVEWIACSYLVILLFSNCSQKSTAVQTGGQESLPANEFQQGRLWKDAEVNPAANSCKGKVFPLKYRLLLADTLNLRNKLVNDAGQPGKVSTDTIEIEIPLPDGTWEAYRLSQVQVMSPELAEKYPYIRTYSGNSKIYPTDQIRLEVNPSGVHAMIMSTRGTIMLDPYCNTDKVLMISFFKKDMPEGSKQDFEIK